MFTLWYTIISWKEYRDVILESITKKKPSESLQVTDPKLNDINNKVSSIPDVIKNEQSKKPIAESTKTPPTPLTQQITKAIPKTSEQTKTPQPPKPPSPSLPLKKPIRLPSPHPIHNDDLEIEYEEESDEEDEEDEEEEDEEDSIVDLVPIAKQPLKKSVNEFINQEISNQKSISGYNQRYIFKDACFGGIRTNLTNLLKRIKNASFVQSL